MSYLDFETIKNENPIEQVAERLGLKLKAGNGQLRGPCPSGQGGERALVITPAKSAFYSFGLGKGGDVIALVALVKECSPKEAAEWLAGDKPPEKKRDASKAGGTKSSEGFKPLDYLEPDHEAVIALGFDPDDAKRIGVGYAPRGGCKQTVAIPVRDESGKLLGYLGITEAILPKQWHF
jgi:DNA primase